jgi:O-antigen ligase
LGLAVLAGLTFGPLAFMNLPLAIVLWLPTVSLIAVTALGFGPNLAALTIVFAWLGAAAGRRSRIPAMIAEHRFVLLSVAALVLWTMLSLSWAEVPRIGTFEFFGWLGAGVLVLVVTTTLTNGSYLRLAIGAVVAGTVVSVAIGLFGGAVQAESDRLVGGSGDPNFLAAGIVPAIMLSLGLAASSTRILVRVATAVSIAVLTIGLVTTGSRGGFIAAAVALIAALVLAKRQRVMVTCFVFLTVGIGVASISVDPGAWERITDFSESTGREELWSVAWQMFQDNPIIGVGLQGFPDHASEYVRALGSLEFSEFLVEQPKVVHNTYLEVLVETGLVGLVLLLVAIGACVRNAWLAARDFEAQGDLRMATLSRGVLAAMLAMLTADFFVSAATDRRLWVLLALGPALRACAGVRRAPAGFAPTKPVRAVAPPRTAPLRA